MLLADGGRVGLPGDDGGAGDAFDNLLVAYILERAVDSRDEAEVDLRMTLKPEAEEEGGVMYRGVWRTGVECGDETVKLTCD